MTIYKKLLAFQGKKIVIEKDGSNPHFKSKYATLPNIQTTIEPALTELGLVVTHTVEDNCVTSHIIDSETGEEINAKFPLVEGTPQQIGSCMTYAKRYNIAGLLNLNIDDDDDGNEATKAGVVKKVEEKPWFNNFDNVKDKWAEMIASGKKTKKEILETVEASFKVSKEVREAINNL